VEHKPRLLSDNGLAAKRSLNPLYEKCPFGPRRFDDVHPFLRFQRRPTELLPSGDSPTGVRRIGN